MYTWSSIPLVRLLLPFIAGILTSVYLPYSNPFAVLVLVLLFLLIAVQILIPKFNLSYRNEWVIGVVFTLSFFLFGYQFTALKTEKNYPNHFSYYCKDTAQLVYARVIDPPVEKQKSVKMVMEILSVKQNKEWKPTEGRAMVALAKDKYTPNLKYGDELIMNTGFREIPKPQNPGEFNYKGFLAFHNISQQAFVKSGNWKCTGKNSGNIFYVYANSLQHYLMNILVQNKMEGNELAVGEALLLGYVNNLDADIIQAYASTGALHVLSVSGLHLTIIYVALIGVLFFIDKIKYGSILKAIILLLFIWFYAMLTGLSPAVLRSAAMLSFIIIAKATGRNTNVYNTIAASVFLLLLFNPYLIMDVGFQLSYIAVIGIVFLQPKIHEWNNFEKYNWLVRKWWELTAVSIAAQIATFPLGLHYFHQFPVYFMLSNYVVIPISFCIMFMGIAVFVCSKIPFFAKVLVILFNYSILLLNSSIKLIEHFPHSIIQGISISVFETWLIYGLIFLFVYYFMIRKYKYLLLALSVALLLCASFTIEQFHEYGQRKLIVYNIPKTTAIDFICAQSNVLLTDSALAHNESKLLFHIKHNWWELGISHTNIITDTIKTNTLLIKNNIALYYNKRIALISKKDNFKNVNKLSVSPLKTDYIIISGNPSIKMKDVIKLYRAENVIFDSSNSLYHLNKWKTECAELHQKYYSVADSGAFSINL